MEASRLLILALCATFISSCQCESYKKIEGYLRIQADDDSVAENLKAARDMLAETNSKRHLFPSNTGKILEKVDALGKLMEQKDCSSSGVENIKLVAEELNKGIEMAHMKGGKLANLVRNMKAEYIKGCIEVFRKEDSEIQSKLDKDQVSRVEAFTNIVIHHLMLKNDLIDDRNVKNPVSLTIVGLQDLEDVWNTREFYQELIRYIKSRSNGEDAEALGNTFDDEFVKPCEQLNAQMSTMSNVHSLFSPDSREFMFEFMNPVQNYNFKKHYLQSQICLHLANNAVNLKNMMSIRSLASAVSGSGVY